MRASRRDPRTTRDAVPLKTRREANRACALDAAVVASSSNSDSDGAPTTGRSLRGRFDFRRGETATRVRRRASASRVSRFRTTPDTLARGGAHHSIPVASDAHPPPFGRRHRLLGRFARRRRGRRPPPTTRRDDSREVWRTRPSATLSARRSCPRRPPAAAASATSSQSSSSRAGSRQRLSVSSGSGRAGRRVLTRGSRGSRARGRGEDVRRDRGGSTARVREDSSEPPARRLHQIEHHHLALRGELRGGVVRCDSGWRGWARRGSRPRPVLSPAVASTRKRDHEHGNLGRVPGGTGGRRVGTGAVALVEREVLLVDR